VNAVDQALAVGYAALGLAVLVLLIVRPQPPTGGAS